MAHQLHLEKKKYRQWVKGGLGLGYLKEGLAPFCDDIARQQHRNILDKIKQTKNLSTVTCDKCTLDSLTPDHVKLGNKQCPLHQPNCNCWYPYGKQSCPNKVCDAIYDATVKNHGTFKPNWKNTDTRQWCTDPWSLAKCFINIPGYENKTSAADTDCTGLLHLIVNNIGFHDHIQGDLNVFSKVIEHRNDIFHSCSMELEEKTASTYIADMIAVLQDGKELCKRQDAKDAVTKLQELMKEDFIITTRNEADVVRAAMESVNDTIHEFENKLREKLENIPTNGDVAGLDTRVTYLESRMNSVEEDVKELKSAQSSQESQLSYIKKKIEFQEKLVKLYRGSLLQVSAIPLQPERNQCNFSEVYVRPKITYGTKHGDGKKKEIEIKSIVDIFKIDGVAQTSVYVLGDAGAGKSSFCKSLVDYWCLAHGKGREIKDDFSGVEEMKKFDFLFYISLRHSQDVNNIQEMIEKQYKSEIITTLLDKESEKVIILLDGLDEWFPKYVTSYQFQTEGLPERDISKEFTIITTSRPWKIETLGITDREMQQRLMLRGFDSSSEKQMIDKSVQVLNKLSKKRKCASDCVQKLRNESFASIKRVPIMLLQLICLWFDDKLERTSRCAIYTGTLELFFSWNDKKETELELFEKMRKLSEDMQDIELPQYLISSKICKSYKYLILTIARLAYETLFKNTKEASLTFDSSIFEQLKILDKVKICCLRLGILSEDKSPSFSASTSQSTVLSFVHKSVQEYLAAVHIVFMFNTRIGSLADLKTAYLTEQCTQFLETCFFHGSSLDAVLEQENVLVMLCGLEPRIATSVSKYVYDVVDRDARVLEYRRTIDNERRHRDLMVNIQQCISNIIREVKACEAACPFNYFLGDIIAVGELGIFYSHFNTNVDTQLILPESVRSCTMDIGAMTAAFNTTIEYIQNCRRLETVYFRQVSFASENICKVIDLNVSTLRTLSLSNIPFSSIRNTMIRRVPDMKHLVALKLYGLHIKHDDFTFLTSFLSGTSRLEQISINIDCVCRNQHEMDLSEHQKLQYLEYNSTVIVTRVNTSNLHIFTYRSLNRRNFVQALDILGAAKQLNKLILLSTYNPTKPSILRYWYLKDYNSVHTAITDRLISLLSLPHQTHKLCDLHLRAFVLTDNIIKSPSELKSMKLICLDFVIMSLTTWRKFVDSLPIIPQAVTVEVCTMFISPDGKDFDDEMLREEEKALAIQYVTEQEQLFIVHYKWGDSITFSTRK